MTASAIDPVGFHWQRRRGEIIDHFRRLWAAPELPMMEAQAALGLSNWLERHGFAVERGVGGLPTAFRATYGRQPGPTIALLAEYDALPGLANEQVPRRAPTSSRAGHACGHNLIGPANIGAAIAARYAMEELDVGGRVVVLGTPAEEIVWGKVAMLRGGVFDGIDALLTSHADYQNGALSRPCLATFNVECVATGEASHAGAARRKNALEAVELAVQTFERLRAHRFADCSVEHVMRRGGLMPSITPDEARLWLAVRHVDYERARATLKEVLALCRSAAEAAETSLRPQFIAGARGYLPNDALSEVLYRNLRRVGPPVWSAEDLAWMQELAHACRPDEAFALDRGLALHRDGVDPYGQDDGEASWRIPLGRLNWAIPRQVPLHHWAATALSGHPAGEAGALMASEALALAALDLLQHPETVHAAQAELARRVAGAALTPPLLGGFDVLTRTPERFWDATWTSDDNPEL
jgi:aminobenzoyl-glutamate utilization protein B